MQLAIKLILLVMINVTVFDECLSREITHEDIKDAMLSLVHMMRENTEKLERHEVRERTLGEQMKKAISLLSKRVSAVDGIKAHLNKLDERIVGIEQLMSQKDDRERIQFQKTFDSIDNLKNRVDKGFDQVDREFKDIDKLLKTNGELNSNGKDINAEGEKLTEILNKLDDIEHKLKMNSKADVHQILSAVTDNNQKLNQIDENISSDVKNTSEQMKNIETSLSKLIDETQNLGKTMAQSQMDLNNEKSARENNDKNEQYFKDILNEMKNIPVITDFKELHNETSDNLQSIKYALENVMDQECNKKDPVVDDSNKNTVELIEKLRFDLANNAERVNGELHELNKGQSVTISMADHILDIKKRVEYGVHQILLEVGDLVKSQGNGINDTLHTKFDGIFNDLMINQNGAIANLSLKMEQEMNQVWRQINVMYQQMSASAKALDKLHSQNEAYVNGTTSTMDGMENKVTEITKRMLEVDQNLNYLLGRLSLVTQEFNQIKTGLGVALDNIKSSFKEVQKKADELKTPGPHPVPENYKEDEDDDKSHTPEIISRIKSH